MNSSTGEKKPTLWWAVLVAMSRCLPTWALTQAGPRCLPPLLSQGHSLRRVCIAVMVDGLPPMKQGLPRPGVCQGARRLRPGADHHMSGPGLIPAIRRCLLPRLVCALLAQGPRSGSTDSTTNVSVHVAADVMALAFNVARADGGLLQTGNQPLPGIAQGLEVVADSEAAVKGGQDRGGQDQINHVSR